MANPVPAALGAGFGMLPDKAEGGVYSTSSTPALA
jgi:hypothetical protein